MSKKLTCAWRRCLCLVLTLALTGVFVSGAHACSGQPRITVGGVTGFDSLTDPAATAQLRKSCEVGLYIHAEGWRPLDDDGKAKILANFAGTGPAVIELGFNATPEGYFKHYYDPAFVQKGVHADAVLVNGLCGHGVDAAKRYIDVARTYGLKHVAVIFAPNGGQYRGASFDDPKFACQREVAVYGKALAIDAPPHVFLRLDDGYRKFVAQEIHWAKQNGVPTYYIVSPNSSGENFGAETEQVFRDFKQANAVPNNYVFETYDVDRTDAANHVGSESEPGTIAGVLKRVLPTVPR